MTSWVRLFAAANVVALSIIGLAGTVQAGPQSETAKSHYRAATQGSADAQVNLAELYANGTDIEQSDTAAFQWFMRAAGQGHGKAQLKLAEIWANGKGVPRNDLLAYKWAYLAKQYAGEPEITQAETLLATLAGRLSSEEVVEARRYATQWKPQLEFSPVLPAETVASAPPRGAEPKQTSRAQARKKHSESHAAKRGRSETSGRTRSVRSRLSTIARRFGY
jgi:hypothetical protein